LERDGLQGEYFDAGGVVNERTDLFLITLLLPSLTHFQERKDVFIKYDSRSGPLTVGYGADKKRFGPELMFGWELGDALANRSDVDEPIYLIKTAWGGRDLAVNFRPPRSGEGDYSGVLPSQYGQNYRDMAEGVQEGLEAMSSIIPGYNTTIGYQISGFCWFQGWNDMIDGKKVNEYAYNLANLVRDVAAQWQFSKMPIIVGELGMHGLNYTGRGADRVNGMRQAEREVPALPEFRSHALFVPTAQYAVLNGTTYNGGYHYNGRAVRTRKPEQKFIIRTSYVKLADTFLSGYLLSHWQGNG